jgi:protein-disulfide isomerase
MKQHQHQKDKKSKDQFIKSDSGRSTMEMLLVPVSIILAGVLIMVSILVSSLAIKSYVKEELASIRSIVGTNTTAASTTTDTSTPAPTISLAQVQQLFEDKSNLTFGGTDKKVIFVEFSDPSCPWCHVAGGHDPELNTLLSQQGYNVELVDKGGTYIAPVLEIEKLVKEGKASFTWIYDISHGNGEVGAHAIYCGAEKGKFWEVHDRLMTNASYNLLNNDVKNDKANAPKVAEFLKDIVNPEEMTACIQSGKYDDKLIKDRQVQASFGFTGNNAGTPGFIVNTTHYIGAVSYTDMKAQVDTALQ